jgi:penicillin-binding protein 1B
MRVILQIQPYALLKYALLLALALAVAAAGAGLYLYTDYAQLVDKALQVRPWDRTPAVYSAPSLLFPGQRLTPNALANLLYRRGYARSPQLDRPPIFSWSAGSEAVVIADDRDWASGRPGAPAPVRVEFSGDRIARIVPLAGGAPREGLRIRPALLAAQQAGRRRARVPFRELPANLVYAVQAAEDQHFFEHAGIDWQGVLRAFFRNVEAGGVREGGSTISQQLAKNIFLTSDRTVNRKFQEAMIALILETRLSKEQLFEIYANDAYLGQCAGFSVYGLAEAAELYCSKSVRNLDLAECAMLAGLIRSPNQNQPLRHPEAARHRRDQVLAAMARAGFILPVEQAEAAARPLPAPNAALLGAARAPYFMDYLAARPAAGAPPPAGPGGSRLASLNPELQEAAEQAVADGASRIRAVLRAKYPDMPADAFQAAFVALDPATGEILAMTGGLDYAASAFNRAAAARRQAGSVIKPFVYARALDLSRDPAGPGLTAASVVNDRPCTIRYGGRAYRPHNYRNQYLGPVTMKTALAKSLNAGTVLVAQQAGFPAVAEAVNRLGFTGRAVPYPSTALGTVDVSPLEIAAAYTVFTNGGRRLPATPWRAGIGPAPAAGPAVFTPQSAFIVLDMMQAAVERGTAQNIRRQGIALAMAAKTGTARDAWFVGLTGNLIGCAWMGFDDRREFPLSGGESALYIFAGFLQRAAEVYPVAPLAPEPPPDLTARTVCPVSGALARPGCPNPETSWFIPGTEPRTPCVASH